MTNKELATYLRNLQAFLVIAGYDELHARRYMHIAYEIEAMGESIEQVRREGRLREIPGIGPSIAGYIKEILDTGTCSKQIEWEKNTPFSVVELLRIPNLGVRTAQRLWMEFRIGSLDALKKAIDEDALKNAPGIGEKTIETWRTAIDRLESKR